MQADKPRFRTTAFTAPAFLFAAYVFTYLIWINYTATGNLFSGIFGRHAIHMGMSFAINPSPGFLQVIYCPLMIVDAWSGRLEIGVG